MYVRGPMKQGNRTLIPTRGDQLSFKWKAPFLLVRGSRPPEADILPARERRVCSTANCDCFGELAPARFPGSGKTNDRLKRLKRRTANGLPSPLRSSDNAIFLISAPFWAVLGHFVSGKWVGWRPGGPKMGRWPDRKRVDRVGHSGPFWAVLGHFPAWSQGDVLTSSRSRQGSASGGIRPFRERDDRRLAGPGREWAMGLW